MVKEVFHSFPPEGWQSSSDEERQVWAAQAEGMLEQNGIVPSDSVQSFAVAWEYAKRKKEEKTMKYRASPVYGIHKDDCEPAEQEGPDSLYRSNAQGKNES